MKTTKKQRRTQKVGVHEALVNACKMALATWGQLNMQEYLALGVWRDIDDAVTIARLKDALKLAGIDPKTENRQKTGELTCVPFGRLTRPEHTKHGLVYASGEVPLRGDLIEHAEPNPKVRDKEQDEIWIVTSVCMDMVRAKCDGAEQWKQAFYCKQMKLLRRKSK